LEFFGKFCHSIPAAGNSVYIIYREKNILKIFSKTAIIGMVFALSLSLSLVQTCSSFQLFIFLKNNAGFLRKGKYRRFYSAGGYTSIMHNSRPLKWDFPAV
jgi:hypothetical protein